MNHPPLRQALEWYQVLQQLRTVAAASRNQPLVATRGAADCLAVEAAAGGSGPGSGSGSAIAPLDRSQSEQTLRSSPSAAGPARSPAPSGSLPGAGADPGSGAEHMVPLPLQRSASAEPGSLARADAPARAPPVLESQVAADAEKLSKLVLLARRMRKGVSVRDRSYHLRQYPQCFVGEKAVAWLRAPAGGGATTEAGAVAMGNSILDEGLINHVTYGHAFENRSVACLKGWRSGMPVPPAVVLLRLCVLPSVPRLAGRSPTHSASLPQIPVLRVQRQLSGAGGGAVPAGAFQRGGRGHSAAAARACGGRRGRFAAAADCCSCAGGGCR